MANLIDRFHKHEGGATAVEYGLIVALICLAIVGGLGAFSANNQAALQALSNAIAGS